MKKIIIKLGLLSIVLLFSQCSDFEEINTDPLAANADQVQVEYLINASIGGAQMNPHIAERVFFLYWLDASNMNRVGTLSVGDYNDGWSNDYFQDYVSKWLRNINTAVSVAEEKIASGNVKEYTNNLLQISRIWRAYIMSEMSDNFGPVPVNGFKGVNPEYSSVKDVYYYMLAELDEAVSLLDDNITAQPDAKFDQAYGFNYSQWKMYGNSLRMRLAMRLSEIDPAKAQQEFEDAASSGLFISAATDNFTVHQLDGWNDYSGVMSRGYSSHYISATYRNLALGLGGVTSAAQIPMNQHANIKPANYMGLKFEKHYSKLTNDPTTGFWLDGLPNTIDPRAYKTFPITGDFDNSDFYNVGNSTERNLLNPANSSNVLLAIDGAFTYNAFPVGDLGVPGSLNQLPNRATLPRIAEHFRFGTDAKDNRVFFASWETHFLIAEAAVRGWSVPMSGQAAYETGIGESFAFFGVSNHLATYLASQDYNNAGTSVSWTHTTEPPATKTMEYIDGYTKTPGTFNYKFPENTIYEGGNVKNDLLSKIITQKYIAQTPWLPLEAWSDHRRLGLPFFENPAVENPLTGLPALNAGNVMTNKVEFFPQRLKYPSSFETNIPVGYSQAVQVLGGPDAVLTPLWWAKQN
ncbi:SusD/RagB family nutrient-binding outer membrane lipoprotein [Gelidibacter salicanalis]|uniref:SusD/RagB family nutrient-binding outer membrane lipoprotein n=1 Tax=Gelidibacter salicanalis TaxID=291193 RepID=A0A934KPL2_9FLAO|nr:SusD/RagB family nutrient-binding outer membrane lipoprotein [Gelidibacter salicanalis]MBJ7879800.1 SusD/RagB family nutrient-binding outer membrane lipoprotein [Gelidibacter salicanalis]